MTHVARLVGRHGRRFYDLRDADLRFREEWEHAYAAGTDLIRDELRRRGLEGWDEPVFQKRDSSSGSV